ncbi:MAG: NUDIX hydrolase [Patescibacteria group bacterium]
MPKPDKNTENLPVIVLGIVKNSNNEVLIIQRTKDEKSTQLSLSWAFPGGEVESGEIKEQTVERELLEETGFQVTAISTISERKHPQFPVYVYYLECKLVSETPERKNRDDEVEKIKWVKPSQLSNFFTTNLDSKVASYLHI